MFIILGPSEIIRFFNCLSSILEGTINMLELVGFAETQASPHDDGWNSDMLLQHQTCQVFQSFSSALQMQFCFTAETRVVG